MKKKLKKKNAAVLFTGGKDSCLALLKAKQKDFNINYLLTILPSSYDSYMYHKPSFSLLKMQAKMLGIPLIIQKSRSIKEKEVEDLEKLLKKVVDKVDFIITGGVASKYQATRIEKITNKLGFKLFNPLWNLNPEKVWKECLDNNFEIILTKICCEGLSKNWLGKIIDEKIFDDLIKKCKKYGFSLEFEGGDAETTVLFMPLFKKKIKIESKIKSEGDYRHFLIIKRIN
jgi:ABC transporter with metal-binding/Fe-S-binding domain ATP-binding protein